MQVAMQKSRGRSGEMAYRYLPRVAFVPVGRLSSLRGLVVERSPKRVSIVLIPTASAKRNLLEQQNMRLRLVDLVVLPAQTL